MKILMLTPYLPYPLWSGGQIRTYNLLKHLSKKHQITLFSFIRDEKEKENIHMLKNFCEEVQVFMKRPPWTLTSLTLSAVTFYPLVVCMYLRSEVKRAIEKAIQQKKFDLIHAETFYVMPNIPQNNIPIILVEQTIEYLVYKHFTHSVKLLPLKFIMDWDVKKINFWEKTFWRRASQVVAMSEADKKVMQSLCDKLEVNLVPNGVDTNYFSPKTRKKKNKEKRILFVGNFKWLQNREAVLLLANKIWPLIKDRLPFTKIWIVGKYPTREILKLSSKNIIVSQNVDDIRNVYLKSDVLLAPIFGPGGTRYKILESMAMKLPVVTTTVGIEGLGVHHGKEALICDDMAQLAELTVEVLTNERLYQKLADRSRKFVEKKFSWPSIADSLDKVYQRSAYANRT